MNNFKHWILLGLIPAALFLTACPGGESTEVDESVESEVVESPALSEISEDSALEDADKILEEIDSL
ncbi:MAG: hypothetical protein NXI24_03255 [bacterium]|nr:hypothetical protein [bacterium]